MTKLEFIFLLKEKLSGLPQREANERIDFFVEMIEDRMEEGFSEEESVAMAGDIDAIAEQIISEVPMALIVKEKVRPRKKRKAWETVLIIIGSPLWIPLGAAAAAVLLALYAVIWSLVVCCYAILASFAFSAIGATFAGCVFLGEGNVPASIAMIGAGLVLSGLAILMTYVCRLATVGTVRLTKRMALGIKKGFMKKEAEK